jgi:hypothetical protein
LRSPHIPPKNQSPEALAAYVNGGIDSVTGYLQSGAISLFLSAFELQEAFAVTGDVAEIGAFEGKTLILMAHALKEGERVIAVDRFGLPPGRDTGMRSALEANLARFGYLDVSDIIVGESQSFTPESFRARLGGSKVRLFSVDGDHTKAAVLHDLVLAESVLAPGGIVAADDIFNPWYPGVTEALYDFCRHGREGGQHDLEPVAFVSANGPVETGCSKLFFARTRFARRYKAGFKLLNQPDLKHCDPFGGFPDVPHFWFAGQPTRRSLDLALRPLFDEIVLSLDR